MATINPSQRSTQSRAQPAFSMLPMGAASASTCFGHTWASAPGSNKAPSRASWKGKPEAVKAVEAVGQKKAASNPSSAAYRLCNLRQVT